VIDRPGGIFVRPADQIFLEDRLCLQSAARLIIVDGRGSLSEQLKRRHPPEAKIQPCRASQRVPPRRPWPRSDPAPT